MKLTELFAFFPNCELLVQMIGSRAQLPLNAVKRTHRYRKRTRVSIALFRGGAAEGIKRHGCKRWLGSSGQMLEGRISSDKSDRRSRNGTASYGRVPTGTTVLLCGTAPLGPRGEVLK